MTKSTGSWYDVRREDKSILPCRIIGKFRIEGLKNYQSGSGRR
ncbi:MAG: hypothetical protein R2769_12260 [Saprospiraceae bacterium]